jgi:arylsulfatase A-like enzyme
MKNSFSNLFWVLFVSWAGLSCQSGRPAAPSVLVIAVENFPVDSVNCVNVEQADQPHSGFQALCRESVRYTHAYTPSTLSQSALTSLLTGLWPFESKVRTNGQPALSARVVTVPELAYDRGYRTGFFSGGPPVLRRSGLAQGFEVFEDSMNVISWSRLHRPAEETTLRFLDWLEEEVGSQNYFSVLFLPDLQSFELPSTDKAGAPINRSYSGRKERLDQALAGLFEKMKTLKVWDRSYVILVGLNGYSDQERPSEFAAINLHTENTQVALLIKGPQEKPRDLSLNWGVDANVSLVDLGKTLHDIFGNDVGAKSSTLQTVSLKKNLTSPVIYWNPDRPILIESAWSQWKGLGGIRYAVRFGPYLYLNDQNPTLFNSLSDHLETSPIRSGLESLKSVHAVLKDQSAEPWVPLDQKILNQLDVALNLWDPTKKRGLVEEQSERDTLISGWLAANALFEQNWEDLLHLSLAQKRADWKLVAEQNLASKSSAPTVPISWQPFGSNSIYGCWNTLSSRSNDAAKLCTDNLFLSVREAGGLDVNSQEYASQREVVGRACYQSRIDRKVSQMNLVNGLSWDVQFPRSLEPTPGELLLALPEHKKLLTYCNERLLTERKDEW